MTKNNWIDVICSLAFVLVVMNAPTKMLFAQESKMSSASIIFLHHSTGRGIWEGGIPQWIESYNSKNGTQYKIAERNFPSGKPYKWKNYPFDYWNIWVRNQGDNPYMEEPTLEILTKSYDVIVWKHCFPVSDILPDTGNPDISSEEKRTDNYKMQYEALKKKMHEFPETKFIVWTGAALLETNISFETAERAKGFFDWVRDTWDEKGDNIYLWDLWELETEGGVFLKPDYAASQKDPHPNKEFNNRVAPLAAKRIVDVIEGKGDVNSITGD